MRRTLAEIAGVTAGRLEGEDATVTGAAADSREVRPGNLFVAIEGERVDGHDFLSAAAASGARGGLVSRTPGVDHPPLVIVGDTAVALARLAAVERDRMTATVVGITGSTGKTSVKDLAAAALSARLRVAASPRSFNTEVGVPLTILNAGTAAEALVLEMGSRGPGHVRALCEIARPSVGVVTGVGPAHLEMFGSMEAVADAKAELVESLPPDGTAILNADDPVVLAFADRTPARALTYGRTPDADVRAEELTLDPLGRPSFTLRTPSGTERVELAVVGEHMASNALAAVAVGIALGLSAADCAAGLKEARLSPWRMEVFEGAGGIHVVNDAYNANPTSMAAALKAARWIAQGGRCVAVLGPMAELGTFAAAEHERIGELAVRLGIDELIVVGEDAKLIAVGATREGVEPERVHLVTSIQDALATVRTLVGESDVVLVKGSRVAGLERLAEALR